MKARLAAVLIGGTILTAWAAPASASSIANLTDVQADSSGNVTFTLTAPGLPPGAGLDPSTAQVSVNGQRVSTTATTIASRKAPTAPTTAMLVVDASGSMRGSGIAAAEDAVREFVTAAPSNVRVGLVTFAEHPRLVVAPTTTRDSVLSAVSDLLPTGRTALFDALMAAGDAAGHRGSRRLVVVSDGADTVSDASETAAIEYLRARHVAVEVVALRTGAKDNTALRRIADGTNGRFVLAGDDSALADALRSSARSYATRLSVHAQVPTALWGTDQHIKVVLESSAGRVAGAATVTVGAVATTASGRADTAAADSRRLLWAGLFAIAIAVLLGALALFGGDVRTKRRARRLVGRYSVTPETQPQRKVDVSSATRTALGIAERVAQSRGLHERLTMRLTRAGVSLTPSEWLLLQAGIAGATGFVLVVFGMSPLVAVAVGVIVGPLLGHLFLGLRASRRRAAFVAALPDTLQLIAGSLSAGYSLAQSLNGVVSEGAQPIAGEFGRALAESRLGVPIEQTLEGIAERMDSEDFRWVVLAIHIQHQVGGNLAEVLLTVAQTMRERVQLHRHVKALSAEGRLSAYILVGLPIFFTLYLATVRGTYLRPLYTTKIGIAMIVLAVVLMSIGSLVMKKMVRVEV